MLTKRLAAGLAAMATLAAGLAAPSAYAAGPAFRDVTASTPHADDIRWAASAGITTGWAESDGTRTFRGMDSVKRQDMAAFMRREATLMKVGDASTWKPSDADRKSFRDVTASTPHADDILWLAHAGITTGWAEPDGTRTFRGMDSVKRQDMAAFMRRLSRLASRGTDVAPKQFRDVTASTPHADDIRWLGGSGVSTGYPDGTYRGMVSVYRQDMAAFLHRLDQLKPDAAASPVQQVVTTSTQTADDAGSSSTFAVKKDGSLWAWGNNYSGQLGVGDTNDRLSPAKVMDNVSTINSDGYGSSFAVRRDGSLWAWGSNYSGQLGVGDTNDRPSPAKVMDDVSTISRDDYSTFAVKKDGSLWAWGSNYSGQLGVGDTNNRPSPAKVMDNVDNVYTISGNRGSSFAVRKDGSLWAWGDNYSGQLGVGDTNDRPSPVKVMDNVDNVYTASGTFAVRKDGSLWAWGYNGSGYLGVGDTNNRLSPAKVMDNVSTISGDWRSTFAVRKDGSLWAWGYNGSGCLGVGDTNDRLSPAKVM